MLFTAMTSIGGPVIIDITFYIAMRFYKPMMTIGAENYTFVVGYKKSLRSLTSYAWAIRVAKALSCFFLNFRMPELHFLPQRRFYLALVLQFS